MDISLDGTRESQVKNRGVMYNEEMVKKILKMFKHTGVRMLVKSLKSVTIIALR